MTVTEYRRTPLPAHAQTPLVWVASCILSLVFSPFVGFAMHGKVAEPGLIIGLKLALIPLLGLAIIAVRRWYTWRGLPPHLVEEWTSGRMIPAQGAPVVEPPVRFANKRHVIEMSLEGLVFSRSMLLSMQGVSQAMKMRWIAENAADMFIAWADIIEWSIDTDSDGPDFYLLRLHSCGEIKLRRFQPDLSNECAVLDAVRSVGKVSLKLCCDVDCP